MDSGASSFSGSGQPGECVTRDQLVSDARKAIACLFSAQSATELRVIAIGGNDRHGASGTFNDHHELAKSVIEYDNKRASGVYYTINTVDDACLHRYGPNVVKEYAKVTSSDRDIVKRNWLPIDIDPKRPTGVSSSDEELGTAQHKASEIVEWMTSLGFPIPIISTSGNGYHVLYKIDVPANDDGLVKNCINVLADRFTDESCDVDKTVYNAARIWKAYGSVARKGAHSEGRPHRRSRIISSPADTFDRIPLTPTALLHELAGLAGRPKFASPTTSPKSTSRGGRAQHRASSRIPKLDGETAVDLEAFLAELSIPHRQRREMGGGGYCYPLDHCIFDASHTGSECVIGRTSHNAIFYKCQHNSCAGKKWRDVRDHFGANTSGKKQARAKIKKGKSRGTNKDGEDDLSAEEIAEMYVHENWSDDLTGAITLRAVRGEFYRYAGHFYEYVHPKEFKDNLVFWLADNFVIRGIKNHIVSDVIMNISSKCAHPIPGGAPPSYAKLVKGEGQAQLDITKRNWIGFRNGLFDFDQWLRGDCGDYRECFTSSTPHWLSTTYVDFDFPMDESSINCPLWLQFLEETLTDHLGDDSNLIDLVQEVFGYAFFMDARFQKLVFCKGFADTGKSTMLRILEALFGEKCRGAVSLADLCCTGGNRSDYARADLIEKFINIDFDAKYDREVDHEQLKKISSGESIQGRYPYREPVTFNPYCLLVFSFNRLPRINDPTGGAWRRIIILPFENKIHPSRKDETLVDKIKENELPGIFYWSLIGAKRLYDNHGFTKSHKSSEELRRYKLQCLPLASFVEECIEQTNAEDRLRLGATEIYSSYKSWCTLNGLGKPKTWPSLLLDLKDILMERDDMQEVTFDGDGLRCVLVNARVKQSFKDDMMASGMQQSSMFGGGYNPV